MNKILFNDRIIEREHLIDIEDRGYQFGDGVYEVIGVYQGIPFMMEEHLDRLELSARKIQLDLRYSKNDLKEKLMELVLLNNLVEGIIYLQASRGVAARWHEFPGDDTSAVIVAYTREEERLIEVEDKGANAILTEDIRWLRCDIKTLNLLPNVLAKQRAIEENAIEAILHRGNIITEGSSSNVFIIKNNELYTHPANHLVLNGITRRKVLQLCKDLKIIVHEEAFTVNDLFDADEVFITATKLDIVPILMVDGTLIGKGVPGTLTKTVLKKFRSVIEELEAEYGSIR